jgi:hypothetical protein
LPGYAVGLKELSVNTPLIVAIEPDQHQAAQVTALLRRQFSVELVLAGSVSAAVARLKGRIPELVLTSALIAPREEAALIGWLRDLGKDASHVQTVTIPMLASEPTPAKKRVGGLSFGWDKPATASAPDSCDPAVFADWITVYLDLATTHREESRS